MIVYITTQGAKIIKEGRHLLVKKNGATYHTLFTYKLDQLVLCGRVELTASATSFLLQEQVDTVFLRADGRYLGRFALAESKNAFLRQTQFIRATDEVFCLNVARQILSGKLKNMLTLLQRIRRTRKNNQVRPCIDRITDNLRKLEEAENISSLMGLEGSAAAAYFSGYRLGLDDDFGFYRRVRRPPTDPVNSVLSLLYTLLINRVYAAIRLAGLDPQPGVLHSMDYGRSALPLDLVEEFRAILADSLVLSLFNLRSLQQNDFQVDDKTEQDADDATVESTEDELERVVKDPIGRISNCDAEGMFDLPSQQVVNPAVDNDDSSKYPVRLKPEAFRKVLTGFEKKLQTEFFHPLAEKRMTYADALVFQARQFKKVVSGELAEYQPLLLR